MLSPGAQKSDGAVQTGDESYGYSSGLAELDEMLGGAVMSEIFYRQGIPTERSLAVIGFSDGSAIGVRSAPNLIRPAHIFRYLKQARHAELKASVDYFIGREVENNFWQIPDDGNRQNTSWHWITSRARMERWPPCSRRNTSSIGWHGTETTCWRAALILDYGWESGSLPPSTISITSRT